ncbi:hypothetical protein HYPSUDRAFT_43015 [Hypholoma sublateritium FD-334 SS-4]|uniref:WSC domain-containing protein n=1 Tax=Hypholoma sublateritium (strain FD-334 SS-4) TaxID=945553 RepID=A0A0D2NNZ5_HYPSF|nr:hypothetical protein HYPSUDRAFT_43015 [Hypholoma sublateritium FD-334 SS-4]
MLLNIVILIGINAALTYAQFFMAGCIALGTFGSRLPLLGRQLTISVMDSDFCQQACLAVSANFAAVYNGDSCMCGNSTTNNGASGSLIPATNNCLTPCAGNPNDNCGDAHSAVLFSKTPITLGGWTSAGCFTDNTTFRALSTFAATSNFNSVEFCTSTCAELGFTIAGMEFSTQCFCGNDLLSTDGIAGQHANHSDCSSPCPGNSTQFCGAGNRLNIWTTT